MYDLSDRLGETEEVVRDIIDFSLKINLFNRDIYNVYCVLTSKSIQERYIQAQKRCKNPIREEFDCINVAETPVIVTETTENMTESAHIILDNIIAVSYTHLDVYKRQVFQRLKRLRVRYVFKTVLDGDTTVSEFL